MKNVFRYMMGIRLSGFYRHMRAQVQIESLETFLNVYLVIRE